MSTAVDGAEPRPVGPPQVRPAEPGGPSARQDSRGEQAKALAELAQSIAVVETACRTESDLAQTLRAIAGHDHGEAAVRRRRLAEDASRGARAAAHASERLQEEVRRRAEHSDAIALRQALDHVARVVAELTRAENDIADILTDLAERNDPDLTAQQRQLASAASAAAQYARKLAQTLHQLAPTDAVKTESDPSPPANTETGRALMESSTRRRLADVDQRLTELRQARLTAAPEDGRDQRASADALRRAVLARRHWQESVANLLVSRQLAAEACSRAARAHDRAAEANARSARAGIGDVAEHRRMAHLHETAASADRQQAQKIRDESAGPAENHSETGGPS